MRGHEGWDDYAPFYDWENAQTLGKRDVPFWIELARQTEGVRTIIDALVVGNDL